MHRWIWAFKSFNFDIRSLRYSCLNIWREFCREQDSDQSCTKNSISVAILLVVILRLYSQSYRDARHSSVFESYQETIFSPTRLRPDFVLQNDFISPWILHESYSLTCVDKFGFFNRLISISEAQDIHVWISNKEVKILPQKICRKKVSVPPSLQDWIGKNWNKGVNCIYKLEETWLGFKKIEKGMGSANDRKICHHELRGCCCILFQQYKRRRHTLLRICSFLSSAEKRSDTVLKQPRYGTVYLHFSEQYRPSATVPG